METSETGQPQAYYIYGRELLSRVDPAGQVHDYYYDGLGSTVALADSAGRVVNRYAYDPFGAVSPDSTEAVPNPFRYLGRLGILDDGNGLLYMRARYYAPALGRFLTRDPVGWLGGSWNLFSYAGNNPVNHADPTGLTCGYGSTEWVPEGLGGLYDFTEACANHDECYACGEPKNECDEKFYADMAASCRRDHPWFSPFRQYCLELASLYYAAVISPWAPYKPNAEDCQRCRQ
jgi:RHS repeat-associated protein